MSTHTYEFNIKMTCGGCSGAVTKALQKAKDNGDGIDTFDVSLEKQIAIITGTISEEDLEKKIAKTGKAIIGHKDITGETVAQEA